MPGRVLYGLLVSMAIVAAITGCIPAGQVVERGLPGPSATESPAATPAPTQKPVVPVAAVAMSDKQRITVPSAASEDIQALTEGNLAFAADLYGALPESDGNLLISPYSISRALVMAFAGARGETEAQMAKTLHYTLPPDRLHPAFSSLDIRLAGPGDSATGSDADKLRLNIVNAAWGQQGYEFLPLYLDILAQYYGAGIRLLDFAGAAEPSRGAINEWVSEQTEGRIEDLLPSGSIKPMTRLVLTNAIYFNAAWKSPFHEESTRQATFHLRNGTSRTVPMMKQIESFGYAASDGYQAVELPYEGGELSMVIVLPDEGRFETFEELLDRSFLSELKGNFEYRQVALSMPKFKFDTDVSLKNVLSDMGMSAAFSSEADFSGMNGNRDLFISDVLHKAFISVTEAGTEAAAATGVVMQVKGAPEAPIEMVVDRPFIFFIRDIETGAILFLGQVLDPGV